LSESLIPYVRERGEQVLLVIVDSREAAAAQKLVNRLRELGAEVAIRALPRGDYIVSDRVAIERKTVRDFAYTLTRRQLFEQVFELKDYYERPILLLEGYMPIIYKFSRIKPASVWGALFALAKHGIAVVPTLNYKESADFIITACKQEQLAERRTPKVHPVKRFESLAEAQVFFLASLPNVGREKAIALLRAYGTPMQALQRVDLWARELKGFGPKIVEKVKSVLHTPYESGAEGEKANCPRR